MTTEPSLNDVLRFHGFTTRPGRVHGFKDVLDASGAVLFSGDWKRTWAWLRETGRYV